MNKAQETLVAINTYHKEHGYPPSYRDLMGLVGVKSTSQMFKIVDYLEKLGWVAKTPGQARSIVVTDGPGVEAWPVKNGDQGA